jgi:hypothetical protein
MMFGLTCPLLLASLLLLVKLRSIDGFAIGYSVTLSASGTLHSRPKCIVACRAQHYDWTLVTDDGAVQKRILEPGTGNLAQDGSEVVVDYVGDLVGQDGWSAQDVVDCWLKSQQGLDHLADAFVAANVDGPKLLDPNAFTEEFVTTEIGVSNKIQCKKLVMAAKRLAKQAVEFPVGTEFDSSAEKGPFQFTLGAGKAIRAYDLAVATMKEGEKAQIVCRADYGYAAEGFRKRNGDVVVPPFATLRFDITLLKC